MREVGLWSNSHRDQSIRNCNGIASCTKPASVPEFQQFPTPANSSTYNSIDKTGQVLLRRGSSSRQQCTVLERRAGKVKTVSFSMGLLATARRD